MVTPNTTPYKPSPLSFGSPRTSPFRRQSSVSPSTVLHPHTPGSSPGRGYTPVQSPSKLNQSHTAEDGEVFTGGSSPIAAPKFRELPESPTRETGSQRSYSTMMNKTNGNASGTIDNDALEKLRPAQLREMREAFQALDRDGDGQVNRDDVADILLNLGQDSSSSATSRYFPPGAPQSINLPTFLNTLSNLLAPLSSQEELLNAFSAFDDDDSGQIDLDELRDALIHTSPEAGESPLTEREIDDVVSGFTGKKAFGKRGMKTGGGGRRGDVFHYQEFVGSITGGAESGQASEGQNGVDAH
ncbi:hypothetical protein FQN54_008251 [Arachnomyces sp. PD_36]|nr:hypothetical protein FQN54_008251 [Arachnomyces sp. PD_36]